MTKRTPEAHGAALERFRKLKTGGQSTPPSMEGSFVFPDFDGGPQWGGQAFDPEPGMFYVNANEILWVLRIVPRPSTGADAGLPAIERGGDARVHELCRQWGHDEIASGNRSLNPHLPYTTDGYNKFLDADGYPAITPPSGTLSAVDLNKSTIPWQVPLGEHPKLNQPGTGSENYGGPIVTASGLVFIGATNVDKKFRVFDKKTGKLCWETELPAGGNETLTVYEWGGREFIVIACGGGKSGAPSGAKYLAFALGR